MKLLLCLTFLVSLNSFASDLRSLTFTPKKGEFYGISDLRGSNSSSNLEFSGTDYEAKSKAQGFSQYIEYGINDDYAVAIRASVSRSEEELKVKSTGEKETYKSKGMDNLDFSLRNSFMREEDGKFLSLNFVASITGAFLESRESTSETEGTVANSQTEVSVGAELSKRLENIELYISPILTFYTSGTGEGQNGNADTDYDGYMSFDLDLAANFLIQDEYSIVTGISLNRTSKQVYKSDGVKTEVEPTFGVGLLLAFNYKWSEKFITGLTVAAGKEKDYSRDVSNSSSDIETTDQLVRNLSVNLRYLF